MKITLIRHTSVAVKQGICYGQTDVDVAKTFDSEAEMVEQKIKNKTFDAVYCSPLQRCQKLAHFCGFDTPILDCRLMEMNFGDWEMQTWENISDPQLQHWFDNWDTENPTHGESFEEMIFRVEHFLNEIKKQDKQNIAVFTHAGVIRAVGIIAKQFKTSDSFDFKVDYGDIVQFTL